MVCILNYSIVLPLKEYLENDDDIPEIPCDTSRMRQVFLNILDNAAKHGGSGKRIIVTNNSSIRWIIARAGQRTEELRPHSSQIFTAKTKDNTATLLNTWSGEESHIVINLFDLAK